MRTRVSWTLCLVAILACGCATVGPPAGRGLATAPDPAEFGVASFYAGIFDGRRTASGERYHHDELTAAHRTLPFGTRVRVTNLRNQRSVVLTINDRGPFARGRIIDVSGRAARELGFRRDGTTRVRIDRVDRSSR